MLAAEALGDMNAPEACDALVSLLEDTDLWVRAAAARGLGRIGGEKAATVLTAHLGTATDIFLLALVEVLGSACASRRRSSRFSTLADHPDPEVRKTRACGAFRLRRGGRAAGRHLRDYRTRTGACGRRRSRCSRRKRDAAAEALLERIADGDPDAAVRQAAKKALGR